MRDLTKDFLELIRLVATDLPLDVERALKNAHKTEEDESAAKGALDTILQNVEMAREKSTPICQDTGTPIFYVKYPTGWSTIALRKQIRDAVAEATALAYLRPNAVDPNTGKNTGNNLGDDHYPTIHFDEVEDDKLRVNLMLKGGGCENLGAQYKLPDSKLGAGRDFDGARKVVLDSVYKAQGKGCAPGILGVAIGGDRGSSFIASKETLFRKLDDTHPEQKFADLEGQILSEANQLGIGPMGFGGKTTLLGAKVTSTHRLPASYFVSISYMCWAFRRRSMTVSGETVSFE